MSTTPHEAAWASSPLSVNTLAAPLVQALLRDADVLGVRVQRDASGVCIVDAGIDAPGSVAAGTLIGEICMGGLGDVRLASDGRASPHDGWPDWLEVSSPQPVLACLGSQYAGWSLAASKEETGGKKFFSLGSGPARALAGKEALFTELGYRDRAASGVIVLEVDRVPPPVVVQKVRLCAGRHCRRQRPCAAAVAHRRRRAGHGPHQRRHPLRRHGAPERARHG